MRSKRGAEDQPTEADYEALKQKAISLELAGPIFDRALAYYKKELSQQKTKRPCFMAADLTNPDLGKIWLLCTKPVKVLTMPTFFAVGQGSGCQSHAYVNKGACAKYFGNKKDWCLPVGGAFRTGKSTKASGSARTFVPLEGLEAGINDNTRARRIGFHKTVTYDGRPYSASIGPDKSQGCFTIPHDINDFGMDDLSSDVEGGSMSFYVYPAHADIQKFVAGEEVYWNARCKQEIGKPAFFSASGAKDVIDQTALQQDELDFVHDYIQEDAPEPTEQ
jgi:hypothetical protein